MGEAQPRTVADAPPTCDQQGCKKPAVYAFAWEWGEKGVCCEEHRFTLNQTSQHLSRSVHFAPLQSAVNPPITRDERIQLHAKNLTLEAELEDAKTRGLDLYRENTKLTSSVQSLTVQKRELEAQVRDAAATIESLQSAAVKRDSEHGDLVDEVTRLRTLSKFVGDSPRPG